MNRLVQERDHAHAHHPDLEDHKIDGITLGGVNSAQA